MIVDSAGIWGYNLGKQKRYIVGGLPIRLIVVIIEARMLPYEIVTCERAKGLL